MRDLLAQEEKDAQLEVEQELMTSQSKLVNLTNRLSVNAPWLCAEPRKILTVN